MSETLTAEHLAQIEAQDDADTTMMLRGSVCLSCGKDWRESQ